MEEKELFWQELLEYIRHYGGLDEKTFEAFVSSADIMELTENSFKLRVPNSLIRNFWEQGKLKNVVVDFSLSTFGRQYQAKYVVSPSKQQINTPVVQKPVHISPLEMEPNEPSSYSRSQLNPNYTFSNFVIGEANKMAHAAALTVCDAPGETYNPYLIYGGVGLGKTHLMQAIGNEILSRQPHAKIKYATTESFTNDFITALEKNTIEEFRHMYRKIDVLLIDDIQFLSNKNKTREEFFHTFNELYNHGKQIVMTCDRLPSSLSGLEDRLISRFAWGLQIDITPPDFETRIAILRKKASNEFSADTLQYIASHVNTNIRELEGALTRVTAYATIHNREITTNLAAEALSSLLNGTPTTGDKLSIDEIVTQVGRYYNVEIDELKGKKRTKEIVHPRQVAMYLCRELTDVSFPKIGEAFGKRNHTTIIHAYEKINDELQHNARLKQELSELKQKLGQ